MCKDEPLGPAILDLWERSVGTTYARQSLDRGNHASAEENSTLAPTPAHPCNSSRGRVYDSFLNPSGLKNKEPLVMSTQDKQRF